MPRPIPVSLAETTPSASTHEAPSADVMRVLGGIGLPGEKDLDRMGIGTNAPEFDGSPWQTILLEARNAAQKVTGLAMPELVEFSQAGIDFAALQTGHEAYEAAGLKPELVLFPVNLSLENWRHVYSELRSWQDIHHPDSDYKLLNLHGADGFYVWGEAAQAWPDLNRRAATSHTGNTVNGTGNVIWKAVVVPTASHEEGGLAVNTSFNLVDNSEAFLSQVRIVGMTSITAANAHMPIGAYLTLQGIHVLKDTPLLDKNTWTWIAGTLEDNSHENLLALTGGWDLGDGQVGIGRDNVDYFDQYLGVRLPVWG